MRSKGKQESDILSARDRHFLRILSAAWLPGLDLPCTAPPAGPTRPNASLLQRLPSRHPAPEGVLCRLLE